jgi:hypothetical protein
LDFARGFDGRFVGEYMDASQPYFAVGEYWDSMSYNHEVRVRLNVSAMWPFAVYGRAVQCGGAQCRKVQCTAVRGCKCSAVLGCHRDVGKNIWDLLRVRFACPTLS